MASSAPDHLRTPGLISNRPCYEGIKLAPNIFGNWVTFRTIPPQVAGIAATCGGMVIISVQATS